MRKSVMLWLVLAVLCGGVLFQTSQRVNDGRAKLAEIGQNVKKQEQSIRVLQAEWSYLNQPERLEKLSQKYLGLEPLKGRQFTQTAALEARPAEIALEAPVVAETAPPAPAKPVLKPQVRMESAGAAVPPPVLKPAPPRAPQKPATAWREPPRTQPYHPPYYAPRSSPSSNNRDFNDVMKSLGVE